MTTAFVSGQAKPVAFKSGMLRLMMLGALAAFPLVSGCRTSTLKGTPFFSNDPAHVGAAEDRVNIWPLVYYRSPALSVLWPIGEFTDECTAIRPVFSMYREEPEAPYTEFNILWPIAKFDTKRHENRIFPFFWGNDDFIGFPLYWHFGPFTDASGTDALFPLWIYSRSPGPGYSLHLAWPFFRDYENPAESGMRLFPLFSSWESKTSDAYKKHYLAFLLGFEKHPEGSVHWMLPFYAYSEHADATAFTSLLWTDHRDARSRFRCVPPLLSWQNNRADGSRSLYFLLGLGRDAEDANGLDSGYFIPFYSYGDDYVHSLLYSHSESGGKSLDILPPLLSWQTLDAATGRNDTYALGGLFHRRRGMEGRDRDWLMPFYLRDASEGLFMTPLWARQKPVNGKPSWGALPPLLSWQSHNPATGSSSLYGLAGLFHRRRGVEGSNRDWLIPLYYQDEQDEVFISPFYFSFSTDNSVRSGIPPLLSGWSEYQDGSRSTDILAGLAKLRRDAEGQSSGYVFPLFSYGKDGFLSLAYTDMVDARGVRTQIIPPLLSWQSRHTATGQGERMILLGLFGHSIGMPEDQQYGHLFPLFAYDNKNESFLTPLFGKWREESPAGTTFHRYWLTPLVKTCTGDTRGWWVLPFYSLSETKDDVYNMILLLGRYEHAANNSSAEAGFFPLFVWRREGDLASALRAMDSGLFDRDPQEAISRDIGWESKWLVWLGDNKHQVTLTQWNDTMQAKPGQSSNEVARIAQTSFEEVRRNRLFPLWSHGYNRTVSFTEKRRTKDETLESSSVLLFLYDSELEHRPAEHHEYVRRRVLWRLWHYERLNGDVSMDLFPAITWDRRKDGFSKTSFLWRFFRYEKNPATGTKLDILFIPLMR